MDTGYKSGQMAPSMKDSGLTIKQRAREHFGMQKVMCMMVSLRMIRLTAMEFTLMLMGQGMKATGKMTCKKDMDVRYGVMEPSIQATIKKERSIIMEFTNG